MDNEMQVEVWLPIKLNKSFTYRIPQCHQNKSLIGHRAVVPFGKGIAVGVIWQVSKHDKMEGIKEILQIPDRFPLWDKTAHTFISWLSSYYLMPLGHVIQKAMGLFRWAFQIIPWGI